jgi:hypothetical protein
VSAYFNTIAGDPGRRARLVREMQALRGSIYLQEGNVLEQQLSPDGRHVTPEDDRSWHLLMTDAEGHISSCAWYMEHENTVSLKNLRVRHCPLMGEPGWRAMLEQAVESEIGRARRAGLRYAEVGGWAVSKARRCTSEGLVLALAAYGLCRILGGALGITTANVKHSSSSILRRLGGSYLDADGTTIPAYFDPRYSVNIELLRFDSRQPDPKYAGLIDLLKQRLSRVPVVTAAVEPEIQWPWDEDEGYSIGEAIAQPALV